MEKLKADTAKLLRDLAEASNKVLDLTAYLGKVEESLYGIYHQLSNADRTIESERLRVFKPLDSTGKIVHTKDKVVRITDNVEAVVVAIISVDNVHIIPVNSDQITSCEPSNLTVTDSFISKLIECKSDQELLSILEAAKATVKVDKPKAERSTTKKPTLEASDI